MKIETLLFRFSALTACILLQACGGSGSSGGTTPPPATSQSQSFDSAQVLALVQTSSETTDPTAVNDGKVTVTGSSDDSSDPITVDP